MNSSTGLLVEAWHSDTITAKQRAALQTFIEDQRSSHPAFANMTADSPAGLLFNIDRKLRWTTTGGEISILKDDDNIIGVSAVELSSFHSRLSIGGIRMWVAQAYRNRQLTSDQNSYASKLLLTSNLQWSKQHDLWAMMVTFNSYNRTLFEAIKRKAAGKGIIGDRSDWWADGQIIENRLLVRHVAQFCALKPIDLIGCQQIKDQLAAGAEQEKGRQSLDHRPSPKSGQIVG